MPGNRKVLIALDGKKPADNAFNWYMTQMCRPGDHVLVFHCSQFELHVGLPGLAVDVDHVQQQVSKAKVEAERIVGLGMDKLNANGIKCWSSIKSNHKKPQDAILEAAQEEGIDHIVMGTRDLGTLKRTLVGSVSTEVVRHAAVPVTIVKTPHE